MPIVSYEEFHRFLVQAQEEEEAALVQLEEAVLMDYETSRTAENEERLREVFHARDKFEEQKQALEKVFDSSHSRSNYLLK
jgi:hypothetical protein